MKKETNCATRSTTRHFFVHEMPLRASSLPKILSLHARRNLFIAGIGVSVGVFCLLLGVKHFIFELRDLFALCARVCTYMCVCFVNLLTCVRVFHVSVFVLFGVT